LVISYINYTTKKFRYVSIKNYKHKILLKRGGRWNIFTFCGIYAKNHYLSKGDRRREDEKQKQL